MTIQTTARVPKRLAGQKQGGMISELNTVANPATRSIRRPVFAKIPQEGQRAAVQSSQCFFAAQMVLALPSGKAVARLTIHCRDHLHHFQLERSLH
jgi:hypothetical protein